MMENHKIKHAAHFVNPGYPSLFHKTCNNVEEEGNVTMEKSFRELVCFGNATLPKVA